MAHFDIFNPIHADKLYRAIDWARWRLQPFRVNRMNILQQLVGAHYSETGAPDRVPVNLLRLATQVYLRQLIAKAPRCMVSTEMQWLKPLAADMEAWMNKAIEGMNLVDELRMFVMDGLVSMGIMKVGEAAAGEIQVGGFSQLVGEPFAERVDLDDWAHDITARKYGQCNWSANRYRVGLEEAKDNPLFDKQARQRLTGMTRFAYNERGDLRSSTLSQSTLQWIDEYEEHIELWDVWLPHQKLVVTVPYTESVEGGFSGPPLRVVKWEGPKDGPFILLGFLDVPNNVMPMSPAQDLMDMHLLKNRIWRKLGRQSDRQKTVLGVAGPNTEDGERIVKANDGEAIRVDRPDSAREFRFGGVDNDQVMFAEQLRQIFNMQAGNIEAIGGLSPQSHTLGQDQLLNQSTSAQVGEMQSRVLHVFQRVYHGLAYWWYKNPVRTYTAVRKAHGVDIPVVIPPQARGVPFEALDFRLDPYSAQEDTPGTRAGKLMQMVTGLLLPAAPMMMQQGFQIDWGQIIALLTKYLDFADLQQIVKKGPPPQQMGAAQQAQGALQNGPQSPVTQRTQIRRNVPMMTNRGHSQVMQQLLAGANQNRQNGVVKPGAPR